jgi:hypothetical protein
MASVDKGGADPVRETIIAIELGTDPDRNRPWPVYVNEMPEEPDNCIVVLDTDGILNGRFQVDGQVQEQFGIQITVRSPDFSTGRNKARELAIALDEDVYDQSVVVEGSTYLVHALSRKSSVLPIGRESENSQRQLFTINFTASIRKTS